MGIEEEHLPSLIVQKFGGTSVGCLEKIERVAKHVKQTMEDFDRIVVVVSAMGGYTDELLSKASALHKHPPKRELDMLITTGERVSMSLLSIALHKIGVPAQSLTGSQCGIITDQTHGNARIQKILGERVKEGFKRNIKVIIVAGFQGVSSKTKEITSLGRGGSDLSAIALAAALKADDCRIYTDVAGIYSTDPRFCPHAKFIKKISWEQMSELAWAGAAVLHHRGAYIAAKYQIPVTIRSSLDFSKEGTHISGYINMEQALIKSISFKKNQTFYHVLLEGETQLLQRSTNLLQELWTQEESPQVFQCYWIKGVTHLNIVSGESFEKTIKASLKKLADQFNGQILEFNTKKNLTTVTILGHGFKQSPEIVNRIFKTCEAPLILTEVRDMSLTLVTYEEHQQALVNDLHKEFFPTSDL